MKNRSIITLFSIMALCAITISSGAQTKKTTSDKKSKIEKTEKNPKVVVQTATLDTIAAKDDIINTVTTTEVIVKEAKKDTSAIIKNIQETISDKTLSDKTLSAKTLSEKELIELNAAMQTIQSILKEHDHAQQVQSTDVKAVNDKNTKTAKTIVDRGIKHKVFVPKGQLIIGGTIGYNHFKANDYEFLMIKDIGANIQTTGARVSAAWAFTNDVAGGIMLDYSRVLTTFDNVDINLSEDMVFSIKDYKTIRHVYTASAFLRTYINIGNSGRFGMYNDVRVSFGGGQGKILNGEGKELVGTYEKIQNVGLTLAPGIAVFATDFLAIGASVGILGFNYSKTEQITNQVYQGSFESFSANFKINILSVNLGLQFYF